MIGYSVYGRDNDTYCFRDRSDVKRCPQCKHLLQKWSEDLSGIILSKVRYDVSYSYDGVLIVSQKFKSVYESEGLKGLSFDPMFGGFFRIRPLNEVVFDVERRKTRYINQCSVCQHYESVVGASPVFLKVSELSSKEFVRTDVEFGTSDEKHPLVLCGVEAGKVLLRSQLKGLDIEEV